jgi:hypothetical protein
MSTTPNGERRHADVMGNLGEVSRPGGRELKKSPATTRAKLFLRWTSAHSQSAA